MTRKFFILGLVLTCLLFVNSLFAYEEHSVTLSDRQLCDLEMLMVGGYAPLEGFLGKKDYASVISSMRLKNGALWPIPVMLDLTADLAKKTKKGDCLLLKDRDNMPLARLTVRELWKPKKEKEAQQVYGTVDRSHPGVAYLFNETGEYYVAGEMEKLCIPRHYCFQDLRYTPESLKATFKELDVDKVVAFQTRNPMHRAHFEMTCLATKNTGAHLLIQPIVGLTKPGDVDPYTRVRCYRKILDHYAPNTATLCVLPLAMRMAGPREAVWHAVIRKNYGATHFIVGRDHAGPGKDDSGKPFYTPLEAQELACQYAPEIGIEIVPFPEIAYVAEVGKYVAKDHVEAGHTPLKLSGTEFRYRLKHNERIPSWFSFPEVISELKKTYPEPSQGGVCLMMTGLSGAGKSTLANALTERLSEIQGRNITLLDGDVIRTNLSKGLGFSKEDRSTNVRRVAYVASEVVHHKGIALCSLIAPYAEDRAFFRELVKGHGKYIEIYLDTPLEVCEARDAKGLYKKVRAGLIKNFTGIDDPYEVPASPDLRINMGELTVDAAVDTIIDYMQKEVIL